MVIKIEAQDGTNMSKFWKKTVSLICMILCGTFFISQPLWSAADQDRGHEVIILFDLSSSAQWCESELFSDDALRQLIYGLPSEWHVGLITFNSNIVNSIAPSVEARTSIHTVLSDPNHVHTYRSPALFSDFALSHTIVLLANNEMAILEPDISSGSAHLANIAVDELISVGLSLHSIDLSDEYVQSDSGDVATRDLAVPEFSFVLDLLPGQNMAQEFSAYLPAEPGDGDSRRILIVAEDDVEHIYVNYNGYVREVELGRRVGIVEVLGAADESVRVEFSSTGQALISAISMQESNVANLTNNGQAMRFWLSGLAEESLFLSSFFDGALVPLFAAGTAPQLGLTIPNVDESSTQDPISQAPVAPVVVSINLPTITDAATDEGTDNGTDETEVNTPVLPEDPPVAYIPEPSPPDDTGNYLHDGDEASSGFNISIFWLVVIAILLALILFFFKRKEQGKKPLTKRGSKAAKKERAKKLRGQKSLPQKSDDNPQKAAPVPVPAVVQESSSPEELLEFAKKFDIYLNQTDTMPAAFALFKMGRTKEVSLQKILRKCSNIRISGELTNTKDIRFILDSSNTLKVVNGSSFKVCVKEIPLQANESRILSQGDNVHIFFEGDRELVLSPRFLYRMSK